MTADEYAVQLPPEVEMELVQTLGQLVVEQTAPEELVLFEETAAEYFSDPEAVLNPRRRDEPVGFGLDMALLTPYVLAIVTPVVRFLASTVVEAVRDEAKPVVGQLVLRLLRRPSLASKPSEPSVPPLSPDHARRVREIAYRNARGLGLSEEQADLLADAVAGGVVVGS